MPGICFKQAEDELEFEKIHRLNHLAFAEEVRQHAATSSGLLIDPFHQKNRYFIAVRDDELLGMISVHDQPPFSVSKRLRDPASLYALGSHPLEVRLLAIRENARYSTLLAGLLWKVYSFAKEHDYTHLLISGIVQRVPMYQSLGFCPLGEAVREGDAEFVPMTLDLQHESEDLCRKTAQFRRWWDRQQEAL